MPMRIARSPHRFRAPSEGALLFARSVTLFVRSVLAPEPRPPRGEPPRTDEKRALLSWIRCLAGAIERLLIALLSPKTCAACDARLEESGSPEESGTLAKKRHHEERASFEKDASLAKSASLKESARLKESASPEGAPPQTLFCPACAETCFFFFSKEPPIAPSRSNVNGEPRPFRIVSGGAYQGALAIAVKRLKYSSRPDLARPLGEWLSERARTEGLTADVVIPVPLHPRKLRARGYNQSALVAGPVARSLGARFSPRALVRTRDTAPQASLTREDRRGNTLGAFRAREIKPIRGKRVLVIDDVATTGATLNAVVEALLEAGAATVTALVLARKDRFETPANTTTPAPGPANDSAPATAGETGHGPGVGP